MAGPNAPDLLQDPLSAWLRATITLLEHGPLDGFRQGWRKSYVEYLDANVASLLAGIFEAGGRAPLAAMEDRGWEEVAAAYGYEPDDRRERRHVAGLVGALVNQLADIGVVDRAGDQVVLTELGAVLAGVISLSRDDGEELDLVDTDAQSLLLVCADEMGPAEARGHLLAWCRALPAADAAEELVEAMLEDEDPEVWKLGFEALSMIDRAVAEPAVRELRAHPGLRPLATAWLRRHSKAPRE